MKDLHDTFEQEDFGPYFIESTAHLYTYEYIEEGIHKSWTRLEAKEELLSAVSGLKIEDRPRSKVTIVIKVYRRTNTDIPKLLGIIDKIGWFVKQVVLDNNNVVTHNRTIDPADVKIRLLLNGNYEQGSIVIAPQKNIEKSNPNVLYHITPKELWDEKIKANGLSPKTGNLLSKHPASVHLFKDINMAKFLAGELATAKLRKKVSTDKFNYKDYYKTWVILQIDMSKVLKKDIHGDDDMFKIKGKYLAVYSLDYIPPGAIREVDTFDVY